MSKRNDITGKIHHLTMELDGEYFKNIPKEVIDNINKNIDMLIANRHGKYSNENEDETTE